MKNFFSLIVVLGLTACGGTAKNIVLNQEQQSTILEFLVVSTQNYIVDDAVFAAVDASANNFFTNLPCMMGDVDVYGQAQLNLIAGNVQWQAQNVEQTNCSFLGDQLKLVSAQLDWSGVNSIFGLGVSSVQGELSISLGDLEPEPCEVSLQINAIVNQVIVQGSLCKIPVQTAFDV